MQDKRLTHRLLEYWNNLRGGAPLPQWEQFNSAEFQDIWQQCCEWKVGVGEANSTAYTYDFIGNSLKEVVGDLTGKTVNSFKAATATRETKTIAGMSEEMFSAHFKSFPAAKIIKKIDTLIKKPVPVMDEGRAVDADSKTIRYRSCLLPFGSEAGKVTNIVLGLSWKAF